MDHHPTFGLDVKTDYATQLRGYGKGYSLHNEASWGEQNLQLAGRWLERAEQEDGRGVWTVVEGGQAVESRGGKGPM